MKIKTLIDILTAYQSADADVIVEYTGEEELARLPIWGVQVRYDSDGTIQSVILEADKP